MNFDFIDSDVYRSFLDEYSNADTKMLRLKNLSKYDFDVDFAITQIECRRKAKNKIPELTNILIYPTGISIEQCTSDIVAKFHASLFGKEDVVVDFTCGLGVDSFYVSKNVRYLYCCDINPKVVEVVQFNFFRLGANNITATCCPAEELSANLPSNATACFIDPSRRDSKDTQSRFYSLTDCVPDLQTIVNNISTKVKYIIVKASPMIDITQTLKDFNSITDIWITSVKNDCKELLFKIDFNSKEDSTPIIHTLNYEGDKLESFDCQYGRCEEVNYGSPAAGLCLFVPNASVMKSGCVSNLSKLFCLDKLAQNTNLFIGECTNCERFPGKIYNIEKIYSLSKQDLKIIKEEYPKANIACRNFPLSSEQLRKKLKIKDGGHIYIFATTLQDAKHVLLVCTKIAD